MGRYSVPLCAHVCARHVNQWRVPQETKTNGAGKSFYLLPNSMSDNVPPEISSYLRCVNLSK